MNFKNFVKLLSVAILVAGYQVNAMDDGNNNQNDAAMSMKQIENEMNKISYANEYSKNMESIYQNFLAQIGKSFNKDIKLNDNQIEMLLQNYSKYLLPKMYYYTVRGMELAKESTQNETVFMQLFELLGKQIHTILSQAKYNTIDDKFYDNYIKLNNSMIMQEFLKVYDSIGDLNAKKGVEQRISYLLSVNLGFSFLSGNTLLESFVKDIMNSNSISIAPIFEKYFRMIDKIIKLGIKKSNGK